MKPRRSFVAFLIIVSLLVVLPAFAAQKKPVTAAELALYRGADRQQILEEGAKKEGKLVIYTTNTENQVNDAFQKKYPFIKVEVWRADYVQVTSRIFQEYKAGIHAVDAMASTGAGGVIMEEAGLLQPFFSPNLAFIEDDSLNKASGGAVLTAGHFQSGIGLGYNSKMLSKAQAPKTYAELLDPKWKGKIAIVGSTTGVTWVGCVLNFYGEDLVQKFARQDPVVHMVSARALLDMIINGEYAFSPMIMDSHVAKSKQKGAPVDWLPLEPVPSYLGQVMLPKDPPNPHAAMLYMDFDLSKEAGEIYQSTGYNSPRKDVAGEHSYKKYYGSESVKQVKQWMTVFNKYFLKK